MKRGLLYILPFLLIFIVACSKQAVSTTSIYDISDIPNGNFLGTFSLIHKSSTTSKLDTSTALITIAFVLNSASYSVGGDTSKIQAPSHGTYVADGTNITFTDATFTKTTSLNAPKKHLSGPFLYTYDGTNLRIYGSSDTLSFNYAMQKY